MRLGNLPLLGERKKRRRGLMAQPQYNGITPVRLMGNEKRGHYGRLAEKRVLG